MEAMVYTQCLLQHSRRLAVCGSKDYRGVWVLGKACLPCPQVALCSTPPLTQAQGWGAAVGRIHTRSPHPKTHCSGPAPLLKGTTQPATALASPRRPLFPTPQWPAGLESSATHTTLALFPSITVEQAYLSRDLLLMSTAPFPSTLSLGAPQAAPGAPGWLASGKHTSKLSFRTHLESTALPLACTHIHARSVSQPPLA